MSSPLSLQMPVAHPVFGWGQLDAINANTGIACVTFVEPERPHLLNRREVSLARLTPLHERALQLAAQVLAGERPAGRLFWRELALLGMLNQQDHSAEAVIARVQEMVQKGKEA